MTLRPVSARRRQRDKVYPERRQQAYERAHGRCEARVSADCNGRAAQTHHVAGRGGPDPHRLSNLLCVCFACHRWIEEEHRGEAYRLGLLRSRHVSEDGAA